MDCQVNKNEAMNTIEVIRISFILFFYPVV